MDDKVPAVRVLVAEIEVHPVGVGDAGDALPGRNGYGTLGRGLREAGEEDGDGIRDFYAAGFDGC